jgi:hypothetical protein
VVHRIGVDGLILRRDCGSLGNHLDVNGVIDGFRGAPLTSPERIEADPPPAIPSHPFITIF